MEVTRADKSSGSRHPVGSEATVKQKLFEKLPKEMQEKYAKLAEEQHDAMVDACSVAATWLISTSRTGLVT